MSKQIPSYLRLVTDTNSQASSAAAEDLAAITAICQAFEQATHWKLEYADETATRDETNLMWSAPVNPGVGNAPGHIRIITSEASESELKERMPLERAKCLAAAVGKLWAELFSTRHALAHREAELAAGVSVVHPDRAPALGERLEAVLRGGAMAAGCQAAALYLLDPATTELKLRASWGLPHRRLTEPARPLRGAIADLEALMGHAVVLADNELNDYWNVPEEGFGASVCVPITNGTIPLGTMWVFCDEPRDFNSAQTNILEVVAGRLASDLEREVLVGEAASARQQVGELAIAEEAQHEQLPIAPIIEGWDVAATVDHAGPLASAFYDWFALNDGSLAIVAGDACESGIGGALAASALRATARALAPQRAAMTRLFERAGNVLWTGSSGGQSTALALTILEPASHGERRSGDVRHGTLQSAGAIRMLAIGAQNHQVLAGPGEPLGLQDEAATSDCQFALAPGELIIIYGTSFAADDERVLAGLDERLALALAPCRDLRAVKLLEVADSVLAEATAKGSRCGSRHASSEAAAEPSSAGDQGDRLLVVIKRRRA